MKSILIIDDEPPIRKLLKSLFESNNYKVIEAANGFEGLKAFQAHHPELVITDLIMPKKEGLETIREMKALKRDVKIIAMSGGGVSDPGIYLDFAKKFGAQKAFSKPVDNDELLAAVNSLLVD